MQIKMFSIYVKLFDHKLLIVFINLFKKYLYLDHANIYLEPCYDLFNLRFLTLHHENKFWV